MLYAPPESAPGPRIYTTFIFDCIGDAAVGGSSAPSPGSMRWGEPRMWGEFVQQRGEGPINDDPQREYERSADVVFFGPFYHASRLNQTEYYGAVDRVINGWQDASNTRNVPLPTVHLMLNMLPATWLVPDYMAVDAVYQTRYNEYLKNLAMIDVAKKVYLH